MATQSERIEQVIDAIIEAVMSEIDTRKSCNIPGSIQMKIDNHVATKLGSKEAKAKAISAMKKLINHKI